MIKVKIYLKITFIDSPFIFFKFKISINEAKFNYNIIKNAKHIYKHKFLIYTYIGD